MRIVFTNGCFDILHRGHIELFKYAKSLGDVLYVGLDSDEKVRQDKGLDRPINSMEDRKLILDSLNLNHVPFFDQSFLIDETKNVFEKSNENQKNLMSF